MFSRSDVLQQTGTSLMVLVLSMSAKTALEKRQLQKIFWRCYSGGGVNDQILHSYIYIYMMSVCTIQILHLLLLLCFKAH